MNFTKKILSVVIACALFVPYTAFAENDIRTSETIAVNIYDDIAETNNIQLNNAGDEPEELSAQAVKFVNYIVEDISENHAVTVNIPEGYSINRSEYNRDLVMKIVASIQEEHPEIFYIQEHFPTSYTYNRETGRIISVLLMDSETGEDIYSMTDEDIEKAQAEIDDEVDKIAAPAKQLESDLEKILYVHDYIVANYKYDERVYDLDLIGTESRTLYSMVHEKTGVCQGYTYLFMTVMKELGIDCITVPSDELAHIWNKVKLDDEWYNIDLTSDDPISQLSSSILHDYFLVNDDEIKELDPKNTKQKFYTINDGVAEETDGCELQKNPDETVTITCGGEIIVENGIIYDYQQEFEEETGWKIVYDNETPVVLYKITESSHHYTWNKKKWDGTSSTVSDSVTYSESPLHNIKGKTLLYDDKFICTDADNNICNITFSEDGQALNSIYTQSSKYKWYVFGQHSMYYNNMISSLELYYDKIYFNSPNSVYEFNPATGEAISVYDYETENPDQTDESKTYFYGLHVKDDKLYVEYSEDSRTAIPIEIRIEIIEPIDNPVMAPGADGSVTVTVNIPESRTEEATVYIAEYTEDGALIKLVPQNTESDTTEFTPDGSTKTVKTFIWSTDNEPLAHAEYEIPENSDNSAAD